MDDVKSLKGKIDQSVTDSALTSEKITIAKSKLEVCRNSAPIKGLEDKLELAKSELEEKESELKRAKG